MLSVGLMSGTSMDGIDAALIETDGTPKLLKPLSYGSLTYDPPFKIMLKALEYAVRKCEGNLIQAEAYYHQALEVYLQDECKLAQAEAECKMLELSQYFNQNLLAHSDITAKKIIEHSTFLHAELVKKVLRNTHGLTQKIDVIGYHGQTLFHRPSLKISIAVGDGQYLANQLQTTVVNNFRAQDIAAGGQGAPFAPLYHQALAVRDKRIPLAVVNCGGIANITFIENLEESALIGFDTGPGNALVDGLIRQRSRGLEMFDKDGQYGKRGVVHVDVLKALYEKSIIQNGQNYFSLKFPKSLDYGDIKLIPELEALSLEDACRTLEAFTADTIVHSFEQIGVKWPLQWVLVGGGWNNPVIRYELEERLLHSLGKGVKILTADEIGWNSQAIEAQTFAYLAVRRLQNLPISFPNTTQVPIPLSGGYVHIPDTGPTVKVQEWFKKNPSVLSK